MKRLALAILALMLVLALSATAVSAQATSTLYTIVFRSNSIPGNAAQLVQNAGGQLLRAHPEVGVAAAISTNPNFASNMRGARGVSDVGVMGSLALRPDARVQVEPDAGPTAADNLYALQWNLRRVNADQVWAANITGSHNTVVAVIDTGIASDHPDLAPNLVFSGCFWSQPTPCSTYPDLHWHGTHVAGTVAAAFGGGRVVGVGPTLGLASYNVFELIPDPEHPGEFLVNAFDEPIWAAMLDAASRGYDVINMSLGDVFAFNQGDAAEWTAWNRVVNFVAGRGVTIVASAGNDDTGSNGPVFHLPSDLSNIISVGATGIRPLPQYPQPGAFDVRAFYSNYGSAVDISAPGGDCGPDEVNCPDPVYFVLSDFVLVDPACVAARNCAALGRPRYAFAAGTSMAAPHVSAVAALLLDRNPGLLPQQVEARLKSTAQDLGDRQQFGHGIVDALAAVQS